MRNKLWEVLYSFSTWTKQHILTSTMQQSQALRHWLNHQGKHVILAPHCSRKGPSILCAGCEDQRIPPGMCQVTCAYSQNLAGELAPNLISDLAIIPPKLTIVRDSNGRAVVFLGLLRALQLHLHPLRRTTALVSVRANRSTWWVPPSLWKIETAACISRSAFLRVLSPPEDERLTSSDGASKNRSRSGLYQPRPVLETGFLNMC